MVYVYANSDGEEWHDPYQKENKYYMKYTSNNIRFIHTGENLCALLISDFTTQVETSRQ